MQKLSWICGFILCAFASGCGEKTDRVEVFPAHGKVVVNGRPADGARVVYYPKTAGVDGMQMPTPAGTTDAAGQYHLESYELKDGAPAGEYSVTVVWPEPPPPNAEELGVYEQKDRLQNRFADPAKSGLTAKIEDGGGELPPLDLK